LSARNDAGLEGVLEVAKPYIPFGMCRSVEGIISPEPCIPSILAKIMVNVG